MDIFELLEICGRLNKNIVQLESNAGIIQDVTFLAKVTETKTKISKITAAIKAEMPQLSTPAAASPVSGGTKGGGLAIKNKRKTKRRKSKTKRRKKAKRSKRR
jgi:hypothetical protein